ncbi:MAG: hypothetical protein JWO81_3371 [Alphaproteobacteria bacterium]|nr:hypothetical protein [Alphaproteobacteria bacterium]
MFSLRNRRTVRFLVASSLLLGAGAAMADILVVRAVGPSAKSFPPGKRMPDNARIILKAGDQVTVLDGRGTREMRGPGSFTAASASSAPAQLASAANVSGRRARIGAVRGVDTGPLRPPTIWHVDVAKSSNVCVSPPSKVSLWRADAGTAATLTVAGSGAATRRLIWPAGAATLEWPDELPVTDGAEYRLSWAGAAAPTTIRFRTLPQRPAGLEATASMLIAAQCSAQLDLLIDTVRMPG